MTKYEVWAIIIGIIAIIQPWFVKLYHQIFKKLKLSFIPSGKIKIYYNRSGAYINMGGVFESKNQPTTIKLISANIERQKDKALLFTEWSSFVSPVYQFVGNSSVTSNETARPFKINTNALTPVFIEFSNTDNYINTILSDTYVQLANAAQKVIANDVNFEDAVEKYKNMPIFKSSKEKIIENYFWHEGDYIIYMDVKYNKDLHKKISYKFNLSKIESSYFKDNIVTLMLIPIYNYYHHQYSFFVSYKDFEEK